MAKKKQSEIKDLVGVNLNRNPSHVKLLWAHIRANAWCMMHLGNCIVVEKVRPAGSFFRKTTLIYAGTGSINKGTWVTNKVFYNIYNEEDHNGKDGCSSHKACMV